MQKYRPTFTLDPEVATIIRKRALAEGKSVSAIVNEILQQALLGNDPKSGQFKPFQVEPMPLGLLPGLDPTKLRHILNHIETEH